MKDQRDDFRKTRTALIKNQQDCFGKSRAALIKNWWDYHKWYVVCGVILIGILLHLIGNALGIFEKKPDLQIAYVADTELPSDTVSALERAFAAKAWDFNGDGEVVVKLHSYVSNSQSPDGEGLYYEYASEVTLIGDIADCESCLFLMDDPDKFQRDFHALALPDGSCPNDLDYSTDDKAIPWTDCAALAGMDLGSYSAAILGENVTGSSQALMSGLYIGRRCFYTEDTVDYPEECAKFWDLLISQ